MAKFFLVNGLMVYIPNNEIFFSLFLHVSGTESNYDSISSLYQLFTSFNCYIYLSRDLLENPEVSALLFPLFSAFSFLSEAFNLN